MSNIIDDLANLIDLGKKLDAGTVTPKELFDDAAGDGPVVVADAPPASVRQLHAVPDLNTGKGSA